MALKLLGARQPQRMLQSARGIFFLAKPYMASLSPREDSLTKSLSFAWELLGYEGPRVGKFHTGSSEAKILSGSV